MRKALSASSRWFADCLRQKRSPLRRFGQEHFRGSVKCYTARRVAFFSALPRSLPLTDRYLSFTMNGRANRSPALDSRTLPSDGPRKGEP